MRLEVLDTRRSGVLLPLISLDQGEGALGREARRFIDWLADAGFSVWQLLPIGPAGADGSPYWLRSDHATDTRCIDWREFPAGADEAWREGAPLHAEFRAWRLHERAWLEDFALFEALAAAQGGAPWTAWPHEWRDRDPQALAQARATFEPDIARIEVRQFLADRAWSSIREHAHSRGVRLFGDLPIYVAPDSVETWQHRAAFQLDGAGNPQSVAGVPPDYFATDGQLWGNPLYDWQAESVAGFPFWRARVRRALQRFDLLRIDHFRGLAAYWAVAAGETTARNGKWIEAPGAALLAALVGDAVGSPFVAEDLGIITDDVVALRDRFALPGMRVLQFAFDGNPHNPHLPHEYSRDSVVYTGTHDNDTTLGWLRSLDRDTLQRVGDYFGVDADGIPSAMIRAVLGSTGRLAVLPMADVLQLGTEARINTPGTTSGNWHWRLPRQALEAELAARFRHRNHVHGRALLP